MPRTTPVGVTYLPGETLWGPEKPVMETSPNHTWIATGETQDAGPVLMYEWIVGKPTDVRAMNAKRKKQAIILVGFAAAAWWLFG